MEENKQYFKYIILFNSNIGYNLFRRKLIDGESTVNDQRCQKWFAKFRVEDFSMNDTSWQGRLAEIDTDRINIFL